MKPTSNRRRGRPSQSDPTRRDPRHERSCILNTPLHISQVISTAPTAREIAGRLADRAEEVCLHLLPGGQRKARTFHAGNVNGDPGESLQVALEGPKAGQWIDHANPEHKGDLLHLWSFSKSITLGDAIREAKAWLGITESGTPTPRTFPRPRPTNREEPKRKSFTLPATDSGTIEEIATVARSRGFNEWAGAEILRRQGLLHFTTYAGHRSWIIYDPAGPSCQARRIDGQPYRSGKKIGFFKGVKANWPAGASMLRDHVKTVFLVEGQPDALAAATLHWNDAAFDVCVMMGASNDIDPEARPLFKGKLVTIYADNDSDKQQDYGLLAAKRWRRQLSPYAAAVKITYPKQPGDLSDYVAEIHRKERDSWT